MDKLLDYSPQHDPDAVYFRSLRPRAARIPDFAATQAHPALDARPKAASLMRCYGALDVGNGDSYSHRRYGFRQDGAVQISRMLGYISLVVDWAGSGLVPNPALTDAAHRYGAPCLGLIFQPDLRLLSPEVSGRAADRLLQLSHYFGFDGFFVNFENHSPEEERQMLRFIGVMREEAARRSPREFQVQYYDGHTDMNILAPVITRGATTANSVMLDQGWSGYRGPGGCCSGRSVSPREVYEYCKANGLDPFQKAFFGLQLYPGPGYLSAAAPEVIAPNGRGPALGSLQLYSLDDGVRDLWRAQAALNGKTTRLAPERAERRGQLESLYAVERIAFSGASGDPAKDNTPSPAAEAAYAHRVQGWSHYDEYAGGAPRSGEQMALPPSYGVANFVVENSPVGGLPFATSFNTGEGESFFIRGQAVCSSPWFNMGLQDLLPTWQWRRTLRHSAADVLSVPLLSAGYDFTAAWDGGSCLKIAGQLDARSATTLWLYKCAVQIASSDTLDVIWTASTDDVRLEIGLVFEDAPTSPIAMEITGFQPVNSQSPLGLWRRTRLSLAPFESRTLAAILFSVSPRDAAAPTCEVSIRLGSLVLSNEAGGIPPTPADLRLEGYSRRPDGRAQARLAWRRHADARSYDVFTEGKLGTRTWLGRVDGDCIYLDDIPSTAGVATVLRVSALGGPDPFTSGPPASLVLPG